MTVNPFSKSLQDKPLSKFINYPKMCGHENIMKYDQNYAFIKKSGHYKDSPLLDPNSTSTNENWQIHLFGQTLFTIVSIFFFSSTMKARMFIILNIIDYVKSDLLLTNLF